MAPLYFIMYIYYVVSIKSTPFVNLFIYFVKDLESNAFY